MPRWYQYASCEKASRKQKPADLRRAGGASGLAPLTGKFHEQGIELLAISTDAEIDLEKSIAACQTEGGFPFPLLSDARNEVFRRYRAYDDFEDAPLHGTFLIDGQGLIRWQDISFEPFTDADFLLQESKRLLAIPAGE